jgi:hypothetical protein
MTIKESKFERRFVGWREVTLSDCFGQVCKDVVSQRRNGSSRGEEEEIGYRGGADVDVDFDGCEHLTGLLWHRKLIKLPSQSAICVHGLGNTYAVRFGFRQVIIVSVITPFLPVILESCPSSRLDRRCDPSRPR